MIYTFMYSFTRKGSKGLEPYKEPFRSQNKVAYGHTRSCTFTSPYDIKVLRVKRNTGWITLSIVIATEVDRLLSGFIIANEKIKTSRSRLRPWATSTCIDRYTFEVKSIWNVLWDFILTDKKLDMNTSI